jgi:hypothetical protein
MFFCILIGGLFLAAAVASENTQVELQISNNSPFMVTTEVKCDPIPGKGTFLFTRKYKLPKKKITNIKISNNFHSCQIWPEIHFLGE